MRKDRMQRRDSTEYRSGNGETNSFQEIRQVPPDTHRKAGIIHIRLQHVSFSRVETDIIPAFVQDKTHIHPNKRGCTEDVGDGQREGHGGVQ